MSKNGNALPDVKYVETITKGTNVVLAILSINGKEYAAHIFGTEPIARDAGRVTRGSNGTERRKKTNTVAKYASSVQTFPRGKNIIQTGFWAGSPVDGMTEESEEPSGIDF